LQAIARVNRLFEGKEYGYVVDYRGVLGDLNEAMEVYNALEGFDVEDVAGTITDVSAVLDQLPQHFEQLWDVFKTVENSQDAEAIERFLEPEDRRDHFYDALNTYASSLRVALSSETFYEQQPEDRINRYKQDLKFFHNLRQSVKQRYAETIDYREYEDKVRKLMDTHIRAQEIVQITELVNIFDVEAFDREVARVTGANAKADTILHRLKKTAIERMDEDPAFYRKFSRLIDETIQAYREGRISEAEKFQRASDYLDQVRDGQESTLPAVLRNHRHASAYFGVLKEFEGEPLLAQLSDEVVANFAVQVEQVIESQKIRDWVTNQDVQNNIRNALEDCLYGFQNEQKISVNGATMDILIDGIVDVAIKRNDLA
jgi:type I restriction enzyme R subunit